MTHAIQELNSATLPLSGNHLIEASAGTGKTYNIVRIYLRLLLEKEYSVDQILVMTFTKAATSEIRNRLNDFLREALNTWNESNDPVIVELRKQVSSERATLLLQQAILRLDESAIYTIHGFCKRALSQQAFFSGMSFSANMDADTTLLKQLAAEDWYRNIQQKPFFANLYEQWPTPQSFSLHWANVIDGNHELEFIKPVNLDSLLGELQIQWASEQEVFKKLNKATARSNQDTLNAYEQAFETLEALAENRLLITDASFSQFQLDKCFSTAKKKEGMPSAFRLIAQSIKNTKAEKLNQALHGVEYIRHHILGDKKRLDQLDFNDLILNLRQALHGTHAEALQQALIEQFPATLVDEFQDTDPDQYDILSTLYKRSTDTFLCMIGDPKQAIYGFRGGDVFAYLKAKEDVDQQWTMNTNYRSSPDVIQGYNQTFLQNAGSINTEVFGFGIEYREVSANPEKKTHDFSDDRSAVQWVNFVPEELPPKGLKKNFQHTIAQWCTSEIVSLLDDTTCDDQKVVPGDIAILVRSYAEAQLMQRYLTDAKLASVYLSSRQNVFQTDEAVSLQKLLKGIWQYENDRLFLAALASEWIGLDTHQLDVINHDEHLWSSWQTQFEQWRHNWLSRGLMSMLLDIMQNFDQQSRSRSERAMTNRLHLAEQLQIESSQYRLPDALLHWFERALEEDNRIEQNLLRLESDDALIKIITMHGSKGLEYPMVFLPFISYFSQSPRQPAVCKYHDREDFGLKLSYLATAEQKQWAAEEDQAEFVRLLYVAITRAEKRVYGCLAPFTGFGQSPLGRTLKLSKYDEDSISQRLNSGNSASLLNVNERDVGFKQWDAQEEKTQSTPAEFKGHIERDWWLSSFSALTRHIGHSAHSAPDRDESDVGVIIAGEDALRFRLAKGAEAGNLLHDALEHCDFSSPDFDSLWISACERYRSLTDTFELAEFQQWIEEILATELGNHGTLGELTFAQTLRESEFYFPMNGQSAKALSAFMTRRRGNDYLLPDRHKLKGMMHGFIDLIFERDGQYFVADYKSTHLGTQLSHYHVEAMQHSVYGSSYDLQYSLYMLALHRYLKSRIPAYDPETHLGGVYYLYLRGMHPSEKTGVYYDPFPIADLNELDRIFSEPASEVVV